MPSWQRKPFWPWWNHKALALEAAGFCCIGMLNNGSWMCSMVENRPQRSSQPDDLLQADGDPLPWREASSQLRAIGIPGTVALLWDAHQRWGRLPWNNHVSAGDQTWPEKGFRTTHEAVALNQPGPTNRHPP